MKAADLAHFLHEQIPATAALALQVLECSPERVSLRAPFALNHNHKNTIFGGSMALLATTCGWSFAHINCPESGGNIVIQSGEIRYLKPALGDLTAVCTAQSPEQWQAVADSVRERGKGRIDLVCELFSEGILVAEFQGRYVVFAAA